MTLGLRLSMAVALLGATGAALAGDGGGALHSAAREGDLVALESLLAGADPDVRDADGRTALHHAAAAGQTGALEMLIEAGADLDASARSGRTPLIEAVEGGHLEAARALLDAGADVNRSHRGGSALETAERMGHRDLAVLLRQAGARTYGKSIGDKVCVRPWAGDGYCGIVEDVDRSAYRIRVTNVVGCAEGCEARAECSAQRPVGGARGLKAGDVITTVSWCLTDTGVRP
jgi:ankyrin repeat protein